MHELRTIVIGAGIGGLCAAIALRQAGFEVEVYERADALEPVGHGLCMWPNGAKALNALGLEATMTRISPPMNAVRFRTKEGELLSEIPLEPLAAATGQRAYPLSRPALVAALVDHLDDVTLVCGAECIAVYQDEQSATVEFADGRSATGDLVIAADGIRSTVREAVFGSATVRSLSWDCEGVIEQHPDLNPADVFTFYVGDGRRAAMLPITHEHFYWFFDVQTGDTIPDGDMRAQLREIFGGWAAPVQRLIASIDPNRAQRLELCDLEPLASFVKARVALLGDAAHATSPFLGQGAAMAAEDGIVIAHYLQTTSIGVNDALARYERERYERTSRIVQGSREKGEAAMAVDAGANERYYEELRQGGRDFVEAVERITLDGPLR